jgi:hypothetical protein
MQRIDPVAGALATWSSSGTTCIWRSPKRSWPTGGSPDRLCRGERWLRCSRQRGEVFTPADRGLWPGSRQRSGVGPRCGKIIAVLRALVGGDQAGLTPLGPTLVRSLVRAAPVELRNSPLQLRGDEEHRPGTSSNSSTLLGSRGRRKRGVRPVGRLSRRKSRPAACRDRGGTG